MNTPVDGDEFYFVACSFIYFVFSHIVVLGVCDNPCEIKHLIWCGVEQTMDQTSIEISKLK